MTPLLSEKVVLEDVLNKLHVRGRYHLLAGVGLTLGLALNTMYFLNYVFIVEEVDYSCATNISYEHEQTSEVFNSSNAQSIIIPSPWCKNPVLCTQWIYVNPDSFVAEFQLACQDWKRSLVGTVHNFGCMIGLLIIGPLSDRFGRRTVAIITGVTGGVCGIAKSFASYYWIYIALEFMEASVGDPLSPLYMLGVEMVATRSRVTFMTTCGIGIVIGGTLLSFINWLIPYWRTSLRVMYAPGLLHILLIYLIDESPRWLLTKGKINAAVKNMEKAVKLNKLEIKENLTMLSCEKDISANFLIAIADTFRSRPLLKRFLVCIIWWNTCTLVGHGLTIGTVLLKGNKYLNFGLSFTTRLPSCIIAAYVMNKFNRRASLISCLMACAVICAGQLFIPQNISWLVITVYMASKLVIGVNFIIVYIFTSELFPTHTRNSMQALCSSVARIGGIVAMQMPLLRVYWSGFPMLIFGATLLLAVLVTLLVPETAKTSLPDTIRQAEALQTRILPENSSSASHRSRKNCTSV